MLTAADEQALLLPVLAGLAAMVAAAFVLAWLQQRWYRRGEPAERVNRPPIAVREPRSHVHVRQPIHDWSVHDDQPSQ